jgi:hypothetical protein
MFFHFSSSSLYFSVFIFSLVESMIFLLEKFHQHRLLSLKAKKRQSLMENCLRKILDGKFSGEIFAHIQSTLNFQRIEGWIENSHIKFWGSYRNKKNLRFFVSAFITHKFSIKAELSYCHTHKKDKVNYI